MDDFFSNNLCTVGREVFFPLISGGEKNPQNVIQNKNVLVPVLYREQAWLALFSFLLFKGLQQIERYLFEMAILKDKFSAFTYLEF